MPAKKTQTKSTTEKKGTKIVEEAKKTKTAGTKTAKKTTSSSKTTTKAKKASPKTETLKNTQAGVETKTEKTAVKQTAAKKTATKKAPVKKAPEKKTATKTKKADKIAQYEQFSLDTCIDMARAMGIEMGYDQYASMLLEEADEKKIAKSILDTYQLNAKSYSFDEDGYDVDLIPVLVSKVAGTVDIKASDFALMQKEIQDHAQYEILADGLANNDEYSAAFDLVKRLLMIAQHKGLTTMEQLAGIVKEDATAMIGKFMDVAYVVLKNWQYDDVKYYENFLYALLSQFEDLYQIYETRAMMDIADLYIEHGDYGLGDANYGYILRENEIKDMIYYRYANAYRDIDREKSRAICNEALQYVDDRYTYYPQIIELLEN
ncbi:neurofilament protein [Faecalicoccus acidiformans]|uniref:neurofilament protein n=1 Tax=Faecalicoccus acidiformans TaxID=915173 RepID=UPI0025A3FE3E|nr:neurofilament protein [Faecalicoccus acidiformans]MDM8202859.1 neurofilament protein [Faecalicoccus acidiformans]